VGFRIYSAVHLRALFFWDVMLCHWVTHLMFQDSRMVLYAKVKMSTDISSTKSDTITLSQNLWH